MEGETIPPNGYPPVKPTPLPSEPITAPERPDEELRRQRQIVIGAAVAGSVLLILIVLAIYVLALPSTNTAKVRDIFIIFMALESLLIGLSLIVLMVQLARLINLLQNEIKPILESTQNTVNTLRGTTAFLSENMVEPVIKLNEYLAALRSLLETLSFMRRK